MTLTELQEIAIRQQQQIEINQQLLLAKEKRLKLLKLEDQKNQQLSMLTSTSFSLNGLSAYNQQQQQSKQQSLLSNNQSKTLENANKLENLKQSVLGQELKIFKLKELRNQIIKHKLSNSNMNSELELIKSLFSKKERELCDAIKNVSELTKQIDQLKKIKSLSFGSTQASSIAQVNLLNKNSNVNVCELEKLKQELQIRNKLNEQQAKKIMQQHEMFNQKQIEVISLDRRIEELQNRIATKRNLNEQINMACNKLKSNSLVSPSRLDDNVHQQQHMQMFIKDLDQAQHNENRDDFEHDNNEYLNELEAQEMFSQNAANQQQQQQHFFQNNELMNAMANSSTSPSKATAKFATKQEIANTYMNK